MLYKKVLEEIKLNKELAEKGEYLGIPYPYSRLSEVIPTIDKGQSIAVLSQTGGAKSKWSRYTFLYHPYKFSKETGYKLRIVYVCMEDNKEKVYYNIIAHYLKEQHGITVSMKELLSKDRKRILPDFILEKLEEAVEYFNDFEKVVTIIDGMTEPEELKEMCIDIASNLGHEEEYEEEIAGKKVKQFRYISDTHVLAIFDNLSNIDSDEGESENVAKLKFAKDVVRAVLCNYYRWTALTVLQTDFENEKQQFGKDGTGLMSKVEPSLAGIGDSKRAARTFHLIFSLFSPARYDFISYPTPTKYNPNVYRIDVLGDKFRALRIIKANDCMPGLRVGLLFDALSETFEELPLPSTPEIENIYKSFGKPLTNNSSQKLVKPENSFNFADTSDDELPF